MIVQLITENIIKAISLLWGQTVDSDIISIQKTNKEFEGDFTVVVFPLLKVSHTSPEATAKQQNHLSGQQ
jgi:arginyl-tRNA synthetase